MEIWHNKIETIKERPELYIGKKSLVLLKAYMDGYMDRQNEMIGESIGFDFAFQEFIQNRFTITASHHWADIITFYSITDAGAFDRFYELLDEFYRKAASTSKTSE